MRIMLIIKAIAALIVIAAMIGTAYMMKKYTGTVKDMPGAMMEKQRIDELNLKVKADNNQRVDTEPGQKAYQKAVELLAMENMAEAETKLKYIVSFYPSSEPAREARRILGEMNVDRLLDPDIKDGKKTISVVSGDSYTRIIAKNKTTMDSLVHLSKLSQSEHNRLRIGQKLTVMPLEFRAVIDTRRKTLTIQRNAEFIKQYPIVKMDYDTRKIKKGTVKRYKLGKIRGTYDGKTIPAHSSQYRGASKQIFISDTPYAIRATSDEDDAGPGFYLNPSDMEELPLLLRPSNIIEIRH